MTVALLAVTAYALSDQGGTAAGAAGDYNASDVAVINAIIDDNGLGWTLAPADGSSIPSDWTGVEWSTAATGKRVVELDLYFEGLSGKLDVSGLTDLEYLNCNINGLTALDVSKNTKLKELDIVVNSLSTLDVSKNVNLESLYCASNSLSTLDVSKNVNLEFLDCSYNDLTALDVSKNTKLTDFDCSDNGIASLDVSKNTSLVTLDCSYNTLAMIDVSKNVLIIALDCSNNDLAALDVSKNTALERLYCNYNGIATLDVSKNTELTRLNCYNNDLAALDVSKNVKLTELDCSNNDLVSLDVSANVALGYLNVSGNYIAAKTDVVGASSLPGFPAGGWVAPFRFDPQKDGTPFKFTDSAGFDVPAGVVGSAISPINVSGGVSGGETPYKYYMKNGPAWLAIDESTGVITGTRPTDAEAASTAEVWADDHTGKSNMITISVGEVTEAPASGGGGGNMVFIAVVAVVAALALAMAYVFVIRPRRP